MTTYGTEVVGYSAAGVGHTVPVHETIDLAWFGITYVFVKFSLKIWVAHRYPSKFAADPLALALALEPEPELELEPVLALVRELELEQALEPLLNGDNGIQSVFSSPSASLNIVS